MSEAVPVWRLAIKDEQHPLHKAAWELFRKDMSIKYADRVLAEQKDEVVGLCNLILDTDDLYEENALGGGEAPINAVKLLCHWKVEDSIPRLLRILDEEDWEADIYGATADEIAKFGTVIVEPLLERAAKPDITHQELAAIAGTLADAAPGDPRTVEFVRKVYDLGKEDFEIWYMAENVLAGDPEGGVKFLENRLRTHKYNKATHKRIEKYLADFKVGKLF